MKELTLVIMAAGMGSRFGGVKQIEPVGPSGEILSEYNIYDAINNGFTKLVFIIRKEHLDIFKNVICKKYEDKIKIDFAFQELDSIPLLGTIPENRVKMLGTTHALLCAKDKIESDFVVINADDYYGPSAFLEASNFFEENSNLNEYVTINYPFIEVSSQNGAVKRGVCMKNGDIVNNIIESEVRIENGKCIASPLDGSKEFEIDPYNGVSMNFFGFRTNIFNDMENYFNEFSKNIEEKNECLLPIFLKEEINDGKIILKERMSKSKWMGMTYKEDLENLKTEINKMINNGLYPKNLWGEHGEYKR